MAGASTSETVPLLQSAGTVEYGGIEPKIHSGYGRLRIPIKPSTAAPLAAGSTYQRIFEQQLGAAAADPKNPLGSAIYSLIYGKEPQDKEPEKLHNEHRDSGLILGADKIKPAHLGWNKETRQQYPEHWKLERNHPSRVSARARYNRPHAASSRPAVILPFSNNIGPGNVIQPARTASDFIAQGHDLHYQDAKTSSEVLSADREAIGQFVHEAISGSDPVSQLQGAIGAAGLGAKHVIETLTGKVLYGNIFHYVITIP